LSLGQVGSLRWLALRNPVAGPVGAVIDLDQADQVWLKFAQKLADPLQILV